MHELAVTQQVLEIALRHAEAADALRITQIHLVVGQLATIVDDSVQFYWDLIAQDTIAQGAQLTFERRPATLRCLACGETFTLSGQGDFRCPHCGDLDVVVAGGDELRIDHIEIETADPPPDTAVCIESEPHMTTRIPVVERILQANDDLADQVRQRLDAAHLLGVNVMASPGAGKTTLIQATVDRLRDQLRIGYVDGDITTTLDAERIAALDLPVVQINTGGDCHLDAAMLSPALDKLTLADLDLLIVENVGNLICPANFRLGTHLSVLVASVPEGDDKPFKYPGMFRGVDVIVLNKIDLLPYIPFDVDRFLHGVRVLNPGLTTFQVSALHGDGMDAWTAWLMDQVAAKRP